MLTVVVYDDPQPAIWKIGAEMNKAIELFLSQCCSGSRKFDAISFGSNGTNCLDWFC